jgi:hypothetical protein
MNLLEEYNEFKTLPTHIGVTYKFFSHFQVKDGQLYFSNTAHPMSEEKQEDVKKFLKAMRKDVKEGTLSKDECGRRMWFWYSKILDLGLFLSETRREILQWLEVCETVLL